MTFKDYEHFSARTRRSTLDWDMEALNAVLGIAGEAGEIADSFKKAVFHEHRVDKEAFAHELGDLLFYLAWAANHILDKSLADIAQMNIDKLKARYPNGFDPERSQQRDG